MHRSFTVTVDHSPNDIHTAPLIRAHFVQICSGRRSLIECKKTENRAGVQFQSILFNSYHPTLGDGRWLPNPTNLICYMLVRCNRFYSASSLLMSSSAARMRARVAGLPRLYSLHRNTVHDIPVYQSVYQRIPAYMLYANVRAKQQYMYARERRPAHSSSSSAASRAARRAARSLALIYSRARGMTAMTRPDAPRGAVPTCGRFHREARSSAHRRDRAGSLTRGRSGSTPWRARGLRARETRADQRWRDRVATEKARRRP